MSCRLSIGGDGVQVLLLFVGCLLTAHLVGAVVCGTVNVVRYDVRFLLQLLSR